MPTLTVPNSYTRTAPKQKRAIDRLDDIQKAGREILAEVGRDRLTTQMVAARAGMSIGSFYRYYEDRIALLQELAPLDGPYPIINLVSDIEALPTGSVLLCKVDEVFWLAPNQPERLWLAAGYDPNEYRWTDERVADWGPLRLIHRGTSS